MPPLIKFDADTGHAPVLLEDGANLSEHLTVDNSPILFGCRTGICGTCLIEVRSQANGVLHPRSDEENDLLPIIAPENPRARLACQLRVNADIEIHPLESE